jgi:glycosyltransferase involved in cell wall biosynthesis
MRAALLSFGFTDYTIQLANALTKKRITVLLVISDNQIKEHLDIINNEVKTVIYKQPRLFNSLKNIFLMFKLFRQIIFFNPNIVHIQGGHLYFSFVLPLLHIKYPLIVTSHDPKPHIGENYLRTRFINFCGRRYSDKIIVHGEKLKEQLIKEYNIPNEKVHAIPIGEHEVAPFKKYERKDLKEVGNLVLFFGRIYKYKGLEYLIKAEPILTEEVPDAKIVIAGTGENFKKYENMMVNKDNFIVHNYRIPYKEGAELFQRCSVVVLPYIDASQSGVIPTAYGFKKPVVVTDVGSIPEIVDDGVTGFIVPSKDPIALADAIIKLLKDDGLRKQMGENAYKKLKTDLSWDKIAEETIDVYKEAINEHKNKIYSTGRSEIYEDTNNK